MNSFGRPSSEQLENRRTSSRVPFASVLGIANYDGTLPDHSEFHAVKGQNLSQTGIAFDIKRWPTSDSIVVMIGTREKPSYAAAHIVSCLRSSEDADESHFEVRCEFERWLTPRN